MDPAVKKESSLKETAPFGARTGRNNAALGALFRKEVADQFRSKRFMIVLVLIALTGLASVYSAGLGIKDAVAQDTGTAQFVFLKLYTASGDSLPSFLTFISFLGPLVGLALGFDAINAEKSRGTMSRLLSQPIYRDTVVNGKFLAGVTVIAVMVFAISFIVGGLGILMIGIPPTLEELARILLFIVFTVVYMSLWLAVSMLFSIIFKHAATSALAVIAVWLFFVIFMQIISGVIAGAAYPVGDDATASMVLANASLQQGLDRISPAVLYSEAVGTILNPGARTLSAVVMTSQLEGAVSGALPLGQSILLVWPHLVGLAALLTGCFSLSYVSFMRQEIRA